MEGVDLRKINSEVEYTLQQLAKVFHCSVSTLRKAVQQGQLKARKRGKMIYVLGESSKMWWHNK